MPRGWFRIADNYATWVFLSQSDFEFWILVDMCDIWATVAIESFFFFFFFFFPRDMSMFMDWEIICIY